MSKHARELLISQISILILVVCLGQLLRIPTLRSDVVIHGIDIITGLIGMSFLISFIRYRIQLWKHPLFIPILGFSGIVTLSWVVNVHTSTPSEFFISSLYFWRWIAYASLIFTVSYLTHRHLQLKDQLIKSLLFSSFVFTLLGFLQYIFLPDFHALHAAGWDIHLHRLSGTFLDPGFAGMYLILGFFLLLPIQAHTQKPYAFKHLPFTIFFLSQLVAIGLTYSRATYLALFAGLAVFAWVKKNLILPAQLISLFMLVVFLLPRPGGEGVNLARSSTVNFRLINWSQSLQVFKDHPLFGVGFDRYRYVQKNYQFASEQLLQTSHSAAGVDNSFLFILATTGILGLIFYLNIIYYLSKLSFQQIKPNQKSAHPILTIRKNLPLISLISLISWGIHSQFHNTLFYAPILAWTGILFGLVIKPVTNQETS